MDRRAPASRPSVGWALIALGALALARAWLATAPPLRPDAVGTRIELVIEELSGDEFRLLPGIGPVLAARLEAARLAAGGRLRPQDLDVIPGIGPALLDRWRERGLLRSP